MSDRPAAMAKREQNRGLMNWLRVRRIDKNWQFYLMLLIPLAWYFVFCYMPMYGIVLSFKKFSVMKGIIGSPWVNPWYKWFMKFFNSPYFVRTISNTFILSFFSPAAGLSAAGNTGAVA